MHSHGDRGNKLRDGTEAKTMVNINWADKARIWLKNNLK